MTTTDLEASLERAQRSAQNRRAAHLMHAQTDVMETTRKGREAADARFDKMVDPQLWSDDPAEARRRSASFRKAFYSDLAAKSLAARRRRARYRKAAQKRKQTMGDETGG